MAEYHEERRLAAILAADMVGYSRLMELDERGTIARQKAHRAELIDPTIAEHHGRIVNTSGDGMLVEFASVVDAVQCAFSIQRAMVEREADISGDQRIQYRIGINLGDIIIDGDEIFGDGINIAARLEGIADPGGVYVSDTVHQSVAGKLEVAFEDLGPQAVKNLSSPVHVWRWRNETVTAEDVESRQELDQEIRFCTAPDGVNIAYALVGQGPPLVKAPNWMHHLEYDWQSPVWGHLLRALAAEHTLVRFDQRCNGLSDWDVPDFTFDSMVSDLVTVVDALGLKRFPLLGISQGCSYSIAYAAQFPERVSRLVLYGGFATGLLKTGSEANKQRAEMQREMILQGWGQDNPAFRQFFTSLFMPGATKEQMDWFNDLQRVTISPENAARIRYVTDNTDVRDLAARISVPTLVLHCREDGIVPFEWGRKMAALTPCSAPGSLDTSLSHAAGLIEIAACHA